jgi:hypothetical protein
MTPDDALAHARALIRQRLASGNSIRDLSLAIGLSEHGLKRWDSPAWNPKLSTLRAVHRTFCEHPVNTAA